MPSYFITHFSISDPAAYDRYVEAVVPLIQGNHGRLLVADDAAILIEGSHEEGRVVVVEFPSLDAARAWQDTPEYQAAAEIRKSATHTHSMILVAGFDPSAV